LWMETGSFTVLVSSVFFERSLHIISTQLQHNDYCMYHLPCHKKIRTSPQKVYSAMILIVNSHCYQEALRKLIPASAGSNGWVCGRSLAGNLSSNPAGIIAVCLLWVFCVVR
jgi:hypothetical protein